MTVSRLNQTLRNRTLALGGVTQAALLVRQVANTGTCDEAPYEALLASILITDPQSADEVYGSPENVADGLRTLIRQMTGGNQERDIELTRYVIALLHLERKLARQRKLLDTLSQGIETTRRRLEHFPLTHENTVGGLADIYSNTISTLTPRILVSGSHDYLSHAVHANRVRAILLAGIRSAVLWSQCGGSRWQLLLRRKAIVDEANRLLR